MAYRLDPELAEIARLAPPLDLRDIAGARHLLAAIAQAAVREQLVALRRALEPR